MLGIIFFPRRFSGLHAQHLPAVEASLSEHLIADALTLFDESASGPEGTLSFLSLSVLFFFLCWASSSFHVASVSLMAKHLLQQRPSLSEHLIADVGGPHTFDGSAPGPEGTVSCLVKRERVSGNRFLKGFA
ncbi:hypothetical protein CEXT_183911 [Caerostris extrusa]|uniref:Uncharacterized protein n=1 Tax=Caerostris extrusa TaxID=172846 RepID=A0AAV4PTE9_CAEEX|nr:hypothetical protein CEXT_183911 [Caerostris extrusa]